MASVKGDSEPEWALSISLDAIAITGVVSRQDLSVCASRDDSAQGRGKCSVVLKDINSL